MRESLESQITDTAPYIEWLAMVGSTIVVCAALFSNSILT
jgi:hypothetical protein